ncbi:MAG: type II toxin-antitoxin system RelE/ParE family toxin [Deltaproteobacteria bacterium]|nr:type II toxin-antitoxin system RelE/ParE family toxin [Deltaproteobacteria bacterium]
MVSEEKKLRAYFVKTESGREPVKDWLKRLHKNDRGIVGTDIKTVEYGWPIGMPTCKSLGKGLWEIRSNISDGRIARVIFYIHEDKIILLHGFIKKTQKTPKGEIEIALNRKKSITF